MFNEVVLNYLRKYKDKYDINDLKNEILLKGYSESDFSGALRTLEAENVSNFKLTNKLPCPDYVEEKKGFSGFFIFIFIFFFLIFLGVGVIFILNYFGISLFNFNIFDFFK